MSWRRNIQDWSLYQKFHLPHFVWLARPLSLVVPTCQLLRCSLRCKPTWRPVVILKTCNISLNMPSLGYLGPTPPHPIKYRQIIFSRFLNLVLLPHHLSRGGNKEDIPWFGRFDPRGCLHFTWLIPPKLSFLLKRRFAYAPKNNAAGQADE